MNAAYRFNIGVAFTEIAQMQADDPALKIAFGNVTYAEFDVLANKVAGVLAGHGFGRRDVVGIVHTKGVLCYAAMLGALKLGVAYVNLDDQNPPARMRHIFESARPKLIIGEGLPPALCETAASAGIAQLDFSEPVAVRELEAASSNPPEAMTLVVGTDPAYIMYTSGSTGVPKGAIITHAGVLNFAAWTGARFGIGRGDVLSNVNPMYFDNSVFDFYAALLNGAALAPISREDVADGRAMLVQLARMGCTVWFSVPSLLIYLTAIKVLDEQSLPAVRVFVFGGEGYPKPELRKLFALFGGRSRLINVYGPTECTCICSAWDVRAEDLADPNGLVTLGPVADNFAMLVLDADDLPVAPGETGELCLLGPQVGLGYVNDAERTERAFVRNPTNERWTERMYRTGDLVKVGADGRSLDFVGRKDNQVKHMGYRIELEEIEAALNQIDGVVQSAVLHRASRRGQKLIVAYIAAEAEFSEQQLHDAVERLLPPYMIPQRFFCRRHLPKNSNGKVDRVALAAEEAAI